MQNPFFVPNFISPSLNRVRIMALPGVGLPDEVQGKSGYELLSAAALRARVRARAAELGLPPDAPDLLRRFDACFTTCTERGRLPSVVEVAVDYGRSAPLPTAPAIRALNLESPYCY
jgi:hypothetical protein